MDELFRRAGEEYPLKTNGADWGKVLQQLHHDDPGFDKTNPKKKDYKYLLLLLLLPVGFICGRYSDNDKKVTTETSNKEQAAVATQKNNTNTNMPLAKNTIVTGEDGDRTENTEATGSQALKSKVQKTSTPLANTVKPSIKNQNRNKEIKRGRANLNSAISGTGSSKSGKAGNGFEVPALGNKSANAGDNIKNLPPENGDKDKAVSIVPYETKATRGLPSSQPPTTAIADSANKINQQPTQPNNLLNGKEINNKNTNTFKSGLSYSLVFGPDVSNIKGQKTSKVGYSLGVMLRYQFSKRLSVEAGAMWDRKNYYSDGKYLDTTRLKLPTNSIVKNVVGYCRMVEIPVNLRYDFSIKQKHSWFVSGGLSSYLMNNEDYVILYQRYNQTYSKNYEYIKSSKDWFSIINLSVGYQKALGTHTNLSIAPYIKLPLQGIGIANLPVSSTGILLSVSRTIK